MERNIYFIISKTGTRFGRLIRIFGKVRYNHTSIAMDPELTEVYAFARQRHSVLLTGKLVQENISRFTLNKLSNVDVAVLKVPVSEETYNEVRRNLEETMNDPEYLYNLYSVLTYPVTKGLSIYKAFTCTEYALYVMTLCGIKFDKPLCYYKPDDLVKMFSDMLYYQGNLLDYVKEKTAVTDYFRRMDVSDMKQSVVCMSKLTYRTLTFKKNELY